MAAKYWLKLYYEMLDDPKVAKLPDSSYRRFIECLLLAGEVNEDGYLPTVDDMAWRLRVAESTMEQDMSRLALPGLVELKPHKSGGDRWYVTSFAKRQEAMPKAEYMRRKRNENQASDYHVTPDVTEHVTNGNTDKIRLDKDIDKDSDEIRKEYTPAFEHIPPEVNEFITALSAISKTTYWPKTEEQYRDAATTLIHIGATVDEIKSFGQWWKGGGSYYKDDSKPSITSVMGSWQDFKDGVIPGKKTGNNGQEYQLPPEYKDIIKR